MAEESREEPENFSVPPPFFPYDENEPLGERGGDYGQPALVQVEGVYVAQNGQDVHRFVLLTDGHRRLPIVIGEAETHAIALPLEKKKHGRPMTHDLMVSLLDRLKVDVTRIVIDDLWGTTYYAKIYLLQDGEEISVDSRPSDAIALAIRIDAPIFVAEQILAQSSS